jgi:hypothetical protein
LVVNALGPVNSRGAAFGCGIVSDGGSHVAFRGTKEAPAPLALCLETAGPRSVSRSNYVFGGNLVHMSLSVHGHVSSLRCGRLGDRAHLLLEALHSRIRQQQASSANVARRELLVPDAGIVARHRRRRRGRRARSRGVKVETYDPPSLKTDDGIADIGLRLGSWIISLGENALASWRRRNKAASVDLVAPQPIHFTLQALSCQSGIIDVVPGVVAVAPQYGHPVLILLAIRCPRHWWVFGVQRGFGRLA